jgi:hypothetical protein
MSDELWWADEAAEVLQASVRHQPIAKVGVRWKVRVDEPHPRRTEKRGDFIDMADGRVTLAARTIWAGWTPGYELHVTLADGTRITGPWRERLVCCDMHSHNCEPPADLCCEYCTELHHPNHNKLMPCVLAAVTP